MSSLVNPEVYLKRQQEAKDALNGIDSEMTDSTGSESASYGTQAQYQPDAGLEAIGSPLNSLYLDGTNPEAFSAFGNHWESFVTNSATKDVFVASSDLSGKNWGGFVTKFKGIVDVKRGSGSGLNLNFSGCNHLIWGTGGNLVAAFDSGYVVVLDQSLKEVAQFAAHEEYVTGLVADKVEQRKVLSAGADNHIKIWDLNTMSNSRYFYCAHPSPVWGVDFHPTNSSNFVSCGQSKEIVQWDLRANGSQPASRYALLTAVPTALLWSRVENNIYCGTESGQVITFDVRQPARDLVTRKINPHKVYRIREVLGHLGVICDDVVLNVLIEQSLESVYLGSATHSDWIRDVRDVEGAVYSVGFNCFQLVRHCVEL